MRRQGLWVTPSDFRSFEEATPRRLTDEIATRARSPDFTTLGLLLPDPDPILRQAGKDMRVYRELLADPRVGACAESRKAAVKSMEWEIDRGKAKSRQARFVEDSLRQLDMDRIIGEILDAPFFGCRPLEVMYQRKGGQTCIADVLGKPMEWFRFAPDNQLRFLTKADMVRGEELPPRKFLLARHNPSYDNPYGERVLSRVYWPVVFKKGALKFWLSYTEKCGGSYLVGKAPRGTGQKEIDELAEMLESMITDAIAVIPDDSSVEFKEPSGKSASSQLFKDLKQTCETDISIAILGQNLTTEVKGGSLAAATAHMGVRDDLKDGDKKIVAGVVNTLIDWLCDANFGPGERPRFCLYEEEDVDTALAERDAALAGTGQVRFTKTYLMKAYGFEEEDIEEVPGEALGTAPEKTARFSEARDAVPSDQAALDALAAGLNTPEALQGLAGELLKPVFNLFESGAPLEEMLSRLHELYPDMDDQSFEDLLARAMFLADVWGRLSAQTESKEA